MVGGSPVEGSRPFSVICNPDYPDIPEYPGYKIKHYIYGNQES